MARSTGSRALSRLDEITRRLRVECPWDREQDERSIVPHTVEEAYELADAAHAGDDAKLVDELGDVLFQVVFLSLLLEERGAGSLEAVADGTCEKLIRRHPHVFGRADAADAAAVRRNWDTIKRTEEGRAPGVFDDIPENLPALLYARKAQRRAVSRGLEVELDVAAAVDAVAHTGPPSLQALGDALFALVAVADEADIDPELALRAATQRFQARAQPEGAAP